MKLTQGQKKDLETITYFIPECFRNVPITDDDIKMFFEYSEGGKHKDYLSLSYFAAYPIEEIKKLCSIYGYTNVPLSINYDDNDKMIYPTLVKESKIKIEDFINKKGFFALVQGKRWRGIHIHEMFEPGILDGSMPYWVILGGYDGEEPTPRSVVDFMKKEMFKGVDANTIENCYQEILYNKLPWYKKVFKILTKL